MIRRRLVVLVGLVGLVASGLVGATTAPAGAAPQRVITYSVATRGSFPTDVGAFAAEADAVLDAPEGWGLGGAVRYDRVASGGEFTLWLAEASTVPSFSSGCSSTYSCRVGRDVIINEARWRTATSAWTGGGGSLGEYRRYVVTHEVGHWIGFGHAGCGGAGQASPVMAQQSITLGGCRFSAVPTPGERDQAARMLGVRLGPTGPTGPPTGSFERAAPTGAPGQLRVAGWAAAPEAGTGPVDVHLYLAGRGWNLGAASGYRPDVAAALGWAGPSHGFDAVVAGAPAGTHQACAYAVVPRSGASALLGCRVVQVPDLFGNLEVAAPAGPPGAVRVGGWALDTDTTGPIDVHVYVGGRGFNLGPAAGVRPDLAPFGYGSAHGFGTVLDTGLAGGQQVCAYAIGAGGGGAALIGCRVVGLPVSPIGALDRVARVGAVDQLRVEGWAIDPSTTGPIDVHVYATGGGVRRGWNLGPAGGDRPDVGRIFPRWGPAHGFAATVVGAPDGPVRVCAYAINVGAGATTGLGCRPA